MIHRSVVIPILNEATALPRFLCQWCEFPPGAEDGHEQLIFVDGGSTDDSVTIIRQWMECNPLIKTELLQERGGLSAQLNAGACRAQFEVLFFPYVDTLLPEFWRQSIAGELQNSAVVAGAFRLGLESSQWRYRLISATANTRNNLGLGPFGDQAFFVRREAFEAISGYRSEALLEDLDLIYRLRQIGRVVISSDRVRSSIRRWEELGMFRATVANWGYICRHFLGAKSRDRAAYAQHRLKGH